jgi:short subunit dehydrogenase-like uncharacterized protein
MAPSREFDLVLLGPTGYTGKLCGEYIVQHTPTNLKWALAGRSASKLQSVSGVLESMNPDRIKPGKFTSHPGCLMIYGKL